jgi:hypothetical protein
VIGFWTDTSGEHKTVISARGVGGVFPFHIVTVAPLKTEEKRASRRKARKKEDFE